MARLVLVGLPGVGKSTLASALATRWRCDAIDTDDVIAAAVGFPTAQFLSEHGEAAFRERELDALRLVLGRDAVVATGAGVVTTRAARELLEREFTLWLDCDDEDLLERVGEGERPLLGSDHRRGLVKLRTEREPWYREVARVRVDASGSVDDVVERVLEQVQKVTP